MKKIFLYSAFVLAIIINFAFSYQGKTTYEDDTVKILAQLKQIQQKCRSDKNFEPVDSAALYRILYISQKNHFASGEAQTYDLLGIRERNRANYAKALEYHLKALNILAETHQIKDKAIILNNIGVVYRRLDDYAHATEYHLNALKLAEEINNIQTICVSLNSLGNILTEQGKYDDARKYFGMALAKEKSNHNLLGIAINYNNIGGTYKEQKQYNKAADFYKKSLETNRILGSQKGIAICYNDLGEIALQEKQLTLALGYFNQSLAIHKLIGDNMYVSGNYINLGQAYSQKGDLKTALDNFNQGLDFSLKIGAKQNAQLAYEGISEVLEKMGNYVKSLEYSKKAAILKDSIRNESSVQYVNKMQIIYESGKKDQEIKLLNFTQIVKDKRQKTIVASLITGCIFLIILLSLIYFNYRLKFKANKLLTQYNQDIEEKNRILTNQKEEILVQQEEIEEKSSQINDAYNQIKTKNENITDNIRYAVQIQNVMLPEMSYIRSLLPNSFVYYAPKDIVSGDFYWIAKKNGQIVLSVADCTGHGVTGAFMSILGISALNEIVVEKSITSTDQILNLLREKIIWTLQQGGEYSESREGIHLVVCAIDLQQNRLQFSGAINSVIIIRNHELLQYKGDRMPISISPEMEDFKSTDIALQKDDMVYLFTDGYYGQFGGVEDRKFGLERFRTVLKMISTLPINEQYTVIENTLQTWKNAAEQVDDILVMGIRI